MRSEYLWGYAPLLSATTAWRTCMISTSFIFLMTRIQSEINANQFFHQIAVKFLHQSFSWTITEKICKSTLHYQWNYREPWNILASFFAQRNMEVFHFWKQGKIKPKGGGEVASRISSFLLETENSGSNIRLKTWELCLHWRRCVECGAAEKGFWYGYSRGRMCRGRMLAGIYWGEMLPGERMLRPGCT